MIQLLFVCHGNICRSPMAQYIFAQRAAARGIACVTDSAATSREEIGNPIYPPAKRKLKEMGVPFGDHRAVQMTRADYDRYDLLLAADSANVRNMTRIAGGDPDHKIRRLLDDCPRPRDIADPWYTSNFDVTYDDIVEGCEALLDRLEREGKTWPCLRLHNPPCKTTH